MITLIEVTVNGTVNDCTEPVKRKFDCEDGDGDDDGDETTGWLEG